MGDTMGKLYTGCLTKRLTQWLTQNNILSHCQKGFLPYDGVHENNYVVDYIMRSAKNNKKDFLLASLDLTNAFGSVPHWALFEALVGVGAGKHLTDVITDIYTDASTVFCAASGSSQETPISSGVKQGCPLSGLLFNITINFILRSIQTDPVKHNILAYADDLIVIGTSTADLQNKLDTVNSLAQKIELQFNPRKCYSMHYSCTAPAGTRETTFYMNGEPIRTLEDGDSGEFLGRPVSNLIFTSEDTLETILTFLDKLMTSKLAPWQRIDALKTFFFPSLTFLLKTNQLLKKHWKTIDSRVKYHVKQTLYLPTEASNSYLYGDTKNGLFGIPINDLDSDIANVDGVFKLLTSKDIIVKQIAWDELSDHAHIRFNTDNDVDAINKFLSNTPSTATSNRRSSQWTRARISSGNLGIIWEIDSDKKVRFVCNGISVENRKIIFKTLRTISRCKHTDTLRSLRHQGKTLPCFEQAKDSFHFFKNGEFTRFAEWRFVHRARLGLVPLNGYSHKPNAVKTCRRCPENETLPHVLCHCMRYSRKYVKRHNDVVKRVKKASSGRWRVHSEDQTLDGTLLRPDLVLEKDGNAMIIDVKITFENGDGSFQAAREEKLNKYEPMAKRLKESKTFKKVDVYAIIVGSLGSWDKENDKCIRRLCSKKYASLMRKLIVSETLRSSRDIYIEHLTGQSQS